MERLVKDLLRLARLDAGQEDVGTCRMRRACPHQERGRGFRRGRARQASAAAEPHRGGRRRRWSSTRRSSTTCCGISSRTRSTTRPMAAASTSRPIGTKGAIGSSSPTKDPAFHPGRSVARLRALLPRRQGARPPRWDRTGPGHRQESRARGARRDHRGQPGGRRRGLHRVLPDGERGRGQGRADERTKN